MKPNLALFFLLALAASGCDRPGTAASKSSQPVIGGDEVEDLAEFPSFVSIYCAKRKTPDDIFHYCGGTVIAPDWVLTAGHCAYPIEKGLENGQAEDLTGCYVESVSPDSAQQILVDQVISHPDLRLPGYGTSGDERPVSVPENDVGLLHLQEPFDLRVFVKPIRLANDDDGAGQDAVLLGRGDTQAGGESGGPLLQAVLPIHERSVCNDDDLLRRNLKSNELCTGYADGSISGCFGDSGGPLLIDRGDYWEQIGVVSWGAEECASHSVFARVTRFYDWIMDSIPGGMTFSKSMNKIWHGSTDGAGLLNYYIPDWTKDWKATDITLQIQPDDGHTLSGTARIGDQVFDLSGWFKDITIPFGMPVYMTVDTGEPRDIRIEWWGTADGPRRTFDPEDVDIACVVDDCIPLQAINFDTLVEIKNDGNQVETMRISGIPIDWQPKKIKVSFLAGNKPGMHLVAAQIANADGLVGEILSSDYYYELSIPYDPYDDGYSIDLMIVAPVGTQYIVRWWGEG